MTLKTTYVLLSEVDEADINARDHTDGDPHLVDSIDRFGFIQPILRDERTGKLIDGHGRLYRLRDRERNGGEPPDNVQVTPKGWRVPVITGWSSKDDADAQAAAIAVQPKDGRYHERTLYDILHQQDDLAGLGFDDTAVAELGTRLQETPGPAIPEPALTAAAREDKVTAAIPDEREPVTRSGDLWLLGRHRVLCGSCTSPDQVARLFDGTQPDLLLTDPPYCSGGFQEAGRSQGSIGTSQRIVPRIANDRLSTRGYQALIREAIALSTAPMLYIFTDWRMWNTLFDVVESSGHGVRSMVVWDKGTPGMGRGWRSQHELVMHGSSASVDYDNRKAVGNVRSHTRTGNPDHPTQKPLELIKDLLDVCDMAETVYDSFAGSGTTILAAHIMGRRAFGMELDPKFCDVICKRYQLLTGEKPTRDGGEPVDFVAAA